MAKTRSCTEPTVQRGPCGPVGMATSLGYSVSVPVGTAWPGGSDRVGALICIDLLDPPLAELSLNGIPSGGPADRVWRRNAGTVVWLSSEWVNTGNRPQRIE